MNYTAPLDPGTYSLGAPFGQPRPTGPHRGLDTPCKVGTLNRSPFSEPSELIVGDQPGKAGLYINLRCGRWEYRCFHLSQRVMARVGVLAGDVVAWTGNTGSSTGPHAHHELLIDGVRVDPIVLFATPFAPISRMIQTPQEDPMLCVKLPDNDKIYSYSGAAWHHEPDFNAIIATGSKVITLASGKGLGLDPSRPRVDIYDELWATRPKIERRPAIA